MTLCGMTSFVMLSEGSLFKEKSEEEEEEEKKEQLVETAWFQEELI